MSTQLGTQKRLLTTFTNKLEHIVSRLKEKKLEEIPIDPQAPRSIVKENASRLEEGISVINSATVKVKKVLSDFASILDRLEQPSEKEQEDFELYLCKSESALSCTFDLMVLMQARLQALISCVDTAQSYLATPHDVTSSSLAMNHLKMKPGELPLLLIPTFGGNIWEWDNFWELFNNNIHSQQLPEMVKYNYLLNALKGEARDGIRKFQVTKDNYSKTINFLLVKYNNREALINQLVERLDKSVLRSPSIKDQRHLLKQLQVIVAQLTEKGEEVNSPWLIKKVLAKFPNSVKRKVITKKQGLSADVPFTMQHLFKFIDEILSTEEMFLSFSEKSPPMQQRQVNNNIRPHLMTKCCMYCKNNHPSHSCTQYSTPQDRSAYLRKEQPCMICAPPKQKTTECKGRLASTVKGYIIRHVVSRTTLNQGRHNIRAITQLTLQDHKKK
ncbi:hypothetical protein RB195_022976 [Necator americanus]|uniref:Peptidase family A16 n=1 Tax=Necator americanus TaxID=51031 RepID=A0ABR1EHX1_NECAM